MAYDSTLGRLPDPTTTPAGPGFISVDLAPVDPGMVHSLNSGATVSVRYPGGSYWNISITYPDLDIEQARSLQPFLYSLQGVYSDFYVSIPQHTQPQTGAWVGYNAQGKIDMGNASNIIEITDWSSMSGTNDITAGDMLKLSISKKIYFVTKVQQVGTKLIVSLNCDVINPELIGLSFLQMNDILFKVRSTAAIPALKLNSSGLYSSFSLSLRENIL